MGCPLALSRTRPGKEVAVPFTLLQLEEEEEKRKSRKDSIHWITHYLQTLDPRVPPYDLPFKLYPFQIEYLEWLEARYQEPSDVLVEKSRDMGVTWVTLAWILHKWRFEKGFSALIGSRKEQYVDDRTVKSLFGILAYMVERLPIHMKPHGWSPRDHRNYMRLYNPENENLIVGESTNPNFSRQTRNRIILLDEYAFWDWAESAWMATADSAPCRVVVSTPNGGTFFKQLRFSGRVPVKTLHWRLHPEKDDEWYNHEKARRTPEEVAQELDISYDRSVRGRVYPEWETVERGVFPYEVNWPLYVSWDFGLDGVAMVWWQRNPNTGMYRAIDCYTNANKTIDFYIPFITGDVPSGLPYDYSEEDIDKIRAHTTWQSAVHYGDPDASKRNIVTKTSVLSELRGHGIHINTRPERNRFEKRWRDTKLFLRRIEGVNRPECTMFDDAMINARFPERSSTSQATSAVSRPIHDWSSHFRTACEYMAVNAPGDRPQQRKIRRKRAFWEGMR